MGGRIVYAAKDAANLLHLFHEVALGVEPAGCIDDEHVGAAGFGGLHGVEGDGRRVAALVVCNYVGACPLPPILELLDGGGAEGVRGGEEDLLALVTEERGQLRDARGLARAVHADHQHHQGFVL